MKANPITAMSEREHAAWCRGFNAGHAKGRAETLAEVRAFLPDYWQRHFRAVGRAEALKEVRAAFVQEVYDPSGEFVMAWSDILDILDRLSEGGEG